MQVCHPALIFIFTFMKKLLTIFFCCCAAVGFAQHQAIPSVGIGNVKIGMPVKDIISIIGKPLGQVSREEEKQAWESAGYHTSSEMVFELSWDKVYSFGDDHPYAIWKIYSRNDTAVLFNMSRFGISQKITSAIIVPGGLGFYNDSTAIIRCLGNDFRKGSGHNNYDEYIYRHKGIKCIVDDNQLCNILLFKAYDPTPVAEPDDCPAVLASLLMAKNR